MFFFSWNSKVGGFPRLGEEREKKFKQMKKKIRRHIDKGLGPGPIATRLRPQPPSIKKKEEKEQVTHPRSRS